MSAYTLTRCLSGFLFIFSMCPRKATLDLVHSDAEEHAAYLPIHIHPRGLKYSVNDNRDPVIMLESESSEDKKKDDRGFDLDANEVKKLKIWRDGVIPYYIDAVSFTDKPIRDMIRSFLNNVNAATSLSFTELPRPPTNWSDTRWVFFVNRAGLLDCADHSVSNMTMEGVQRIVLGYHCLTMGAELADAVLAIAGVPAQHNAPNRDQFIKVNQENIIPEKKYLFKKLKDNEWLFHGIDYDYKSAGHFPSHRHSINGRATIEIKKPSKKPILLEPKKLSHKDVLKINMLYNYLTRANRQGNVPGCSKLFKLGKAVDESQTLKIQARPKPGKYLEGKGEKENDGSKDASGSEKDSDGDDAKKSSGGGGDDDGSGDEGGGSKDDDDDEKSSGRDDKDKSSVANDGSGDDEDEALNGPNSVNDPLNDMTDYDTSKMK
ncbi:zinc metalloproteinase nas-12-like [Anticarsia gemmatalis]|uniref:zinc metalloproteinase nas-12-like n=1 Tax=Anticarsia gemmatalis TaxID=129554 RepID=UPI003F76A98E